ncbi:preprotein translocase subunit SecG [Salinimonas iocasae]|uniref:Protein-export membrane protein SecG n=1 Tax=Salinimonas iocasae TaxID=2572577 RepID=A0A5B7YD50_9ALTE|nr:preprotein translocase subunit SecG [Salinimonas iocasae]QCZ93627.1 preprotein translocase subunit SecG [Salinimonas iocasae]
MVYEVLLVAYLVVALILVGFILIQQGKGADMGASFGAGGSNTVFGSSGSGNFMTRTTAILATLFFLISLTLGNLTANRESPSDDWNNLEEPVQQTAPAATEGDIPGADDNESSDTPD